MAAPDFLMLGWAELAAKRAAAWAGGDPMWVRRDASGRFTTASTGMAAPPLEFPETSVYTPAKWRAAKRYEFDGELPVLVDTTKLPDDFLDDAPFTLDDLIDVVRSQKGAEVFDPKDDVRVQLEVAGAGETASGRRTVSLRATISNPLGVDYARVSRYVRWNHDNSFDPHVSIEPSVLEINHAFRRKGIGSEYLANYIAFAKRFGQTSITFLAGLDHGAYFWPRMGFDWADRYGAKETIKRKVEQRFSHDPFVRDGVLRSLEKFDHAYDLARWVDTDEDSPSYGVTGKDVLEGNSIMVRLPLRDGEDNKQLRILEHELDKHKVKLKLGDEIEWPWPDHDPDFDWEDYLPWTEEEKALSFPVIDEDDDDEIARLSFGISARAAWRAGDPKWVKRDSFGRFSVTSGMATPSTDDRDTSRVRKGFREEFKDHGALDLGRCFEFGLQRFLEMEDDPDARLVHGVMDMGKAMESSGHGGIPPGLWYTVHGWIERGDGRVEDWQGLVGVHEDGLDVKDFYEMLGISDERPLIKYDQTSAREHTLLNQTYGPWDNEFIWYS